MLFQVQKRVYVIPDLIRDPGNQIRLDLDPRLHGDDSGMLPSLFPSGMGRGWGGRHIPLP